MHNEYLDDSNKFFENLKRQRDECIEELKDLYNDDIEDYIYSTVNFKNILDYDEIRKSTDITRDYDDIKAIVKICLEKQHINKQLDFDLFNELIRNQLDFRSKAALLLDDKANEDTVLVMSVMLKIAFCRYMHNSNEDIIIEHHKMLLQLLDEQSKQREHTSQHTTNRLKDYFDYYKDKYELIPEGNPITGNYSLKQSYYAAYDSKHVQIIDRIERWADPNHGKVMLLHGQPGHGKTSFCYHVMYQFLEKKKLTKMKNIFYFNLNPRDWYNPLKSEHSVFDALIWDDLTFELDELRNSIVLLDGYDELKGEYGNEFPLNNLLYDLKRYAQTRKITFIVTSRTTAVIDDLDDLKKDNNLTVIEFAHLKLEDQNRWVKQFDLTGSKYQEEWEKLKKTELYKKFFYREEKETRWLYNNQEEPSLLGIPILFRIVILNPFSDDKEIHNRAGLYAELLDVTLTRDENRKNRKEKLVLKYENLAYRIFANKERKDTITDLKDEDNELLFSYYLKGDKYEIGFIHRSFYQYFLACYLYKKIKSISLKQNSSTIAYEYLTCLLHRRLDVDELNFIKEIYDNDQDNSELKSKYETIFDELVKTQSVVFDKDVDDKHCLSNLDECANVYNNCINIMSKLELKIMLQQERFNSLIDLMRKYPIEGLNISYQSFNRVNFSRMKLQSVNFSNSTCFFCKFNGSDLREARFNDADLIGSRMVGCNLGYASFGGARIDFVDFRGTRINKYNVEENMTEIKEDKKIVRMPIYNLEQFDIYNQGIKIGTYQNEEIIGRALDYNDSDGKLTVITEKIIDNKIYYRGWKYITWKESDIRKELNGYRTGIEAIKGIVNQIEYEEGIEIIETENENKDNEEYGIKGGKSTTDKMYLLSIEEANRYFIDEEDREAMGTEFAKNGRESNLRISSGTGNSWWWLRSPGVYSDFAARVGNSGKVDNIGYNVASTNIGVRPTFKIQILNHKSSN